MTEPNPLFRAASLVAERSLDFLVAAELAADGGRPEDALACLHGVAVLAGSEVDQALADASEALARVAEGRVVIHGQSGPLDFASAHDAVRHLWMVVFLLEGSPSLIHPDLCDWLGVSTSRLRALLQRERVRMLPLPPIAPATPSTAKADYGKISLEARALAVFIEHPDWTKKEIAKHLGAHEKSLAPDRCPKLAAAIAAHKASIDPGRRRVRGSKDSDGNLEAWEEDEE